MRGDRNKTIEVDGASVEAAIEKALLVLKVSRDDVVVKIVSEEQKGLFGMSGAKPAKVVVSIKEKLDKC